MAGPDSFQPERRSAFRCPATGEREVVLRVKGKEFDVQILDESRDGISVLTVESPGVADGDVVELKSESGVIRAKIIRVRRFGSAYRVGMQRLGDIPESMPKGSPWAVLMHNQQSAGHGASQAKISTFAFGIWMAVGSAAAIAAVYWSMSGHGKKAGPSQREATTAGVSRSSSAAGSEAAPRITSATPFSLSSAGEYLQLSEAQRLKILQIIAKATASAPEIRRVSVTGSTAGLPPQAEARLNAAMVEALNVLDDRQRQLWRNLMAMN